jgi:urea transporter
MRGPRESKRPSLAIPFVLCVRHVLLLSTINLHGGTANNLPANNSSCNLSEFPRRRRGNASAIECFKLRVDVERARV